MIGANRSGTSVVSAILAQHPELEGLYAGETEECTDAAGHSLGFCESYHVWLSLSPKEGRRRRNRQLPFWALPQYVGEVYRTRAIDDPERFELAWSVERHRKTRLRPLIKDQFNMLRVGLIRDVFPDARFVLVNRQFASYCERGIHKWKHDGNGTRLTPTDPRTGLHWHMVNLIARYDLESYAAGQYCELCLDELQASEERATAAFGRVARVMGLAAYDFDYSLLERSWDKPPVASNSVGEGVFDAVSDIVAFEREVIGSDEELGSGEGFPLRRQDSKS